ncbi:aspartic peptidase domain-containing protein [Trametes elegans]|nr:aspartic peptidase domain-containing protein [Trametes elegans]
MRHDYLTGILGGQRPWLIFASYVSLVIFANSSCRGRCAQATGHRGGAVAPAAMHLPIHRRGSARHDGVHNHRRAAATMVGVGDNMDVTYNVLVQVGKTSTPLIIDTGSSDLWLLSGRCKEHCPTTNVPLYLGSALKSVGQDVRLLYGDSHTGAHSSGPTGTDTVTIAGLSVPDQTFAAVVDTNTTVLDTGFAGILGLGFPPISLIWRQLVAAQLNSTMHSLLRRALLRDEHAVLRTRADYMDSTVHHQKRQGGTGSLDFPVDTVSTIGPLLTRLVTPKILERPLAVTTLQRDTISFSANDGTLSPGALPLGISNDKLAWAPVRSYPMAQGGLPPPLISLEETRISAYPLLSEIPVDDVYLVSHSTLSSPSISLSALVDTGNSPIRGPQDVLAEIYFRLRLDAAGTFACSDPPNLTFVFGRVSLSVDPRDIAHPVAVDPGTFYPDQAARCTPALAATDPPVHGGFLYSWSLGDPFLKATMVAFYYGNMTHPSEDPARVGFKSMVPPDSNFALKEAVEAAIQDGGVFLCACSCLDPRYTLTHRRPVCEAHDDRD